MAEQSLEDLYLGKVGFLKFLAAVPKHLANLKTHDWSIFHWQIYFAVIYYTCIRPGAEARRLTKKDFNLQSKILNASNHKGSYKKTTIPPPLMEPLKKFLKAKSDDELLFPMSRQTAWSYVKEIGKLAGIKYFEEFEKRQIQGLYLYVFKHAYIQRLEFEGCPPSLISIKARHSPDSGRGMARQTTNYAKSLRGLMIWETQHITEELPI